MPLKKISVPPGKTRTRQSCAKAMPISVSFKSDCTSRIVPQPTGRMPPRVSCLRGVPPVAPAARRSAPESGEQAPNHAHLPQPASKTVSNNPSSFTAASSLISDMDSDMSASPISPSRQRELMYSTTGTHWSWCCAGARSSHVFNYCVMRCIGSGKDTLGHWGWCCANAGRRHMFDHSVRRYVGCVCSITGAGAAPVSAGATYSITVSCAAYDVRGRHRRWRLTLRRRHLSRLQVRDLRAHRGYHGRHHHRVALS